jgi:predicted amidophosphoribosyltransferase
MDTSKDDPPCPACGTAAPLVDGACSDCGLQLE